MGILRFARRPGAIADAIAVVFSLWQLYALTMVSVDAWLLRASHLAFAALIVIRTAILDRAAAGRAERLAGWTMAAVAVAGLAYVVLDLEGIQFRTGVAPTMGDIVVGTLTLALIIDLVRRTTGWALAAVVGLAIVYALFGHLLPGFLGTRGYSYQRVVSYLFGSEGIYGIPIGASATYVFIFVLFGAFLHASKAGEFFIGLASAAVGGRRGGPAKMAVVSSALFGTISGSAVSNVVVSGSLTIPLMKRHGYPPALAGAVEAVASSGGQLMPPVMGAAAFLMADIAGIPYADIAVAALMPALLYFLSLYWIVDLESGKRGFRGLDRGEITPLGASLRDLHLLAPIAAVLYFLLVERTSPILAGLWGGIVCVAVSWLRTGTRIGPRALLGALAAGGRGIAEVAITCAAAGIIIGVLSMTGLGIKVANSLMAFSGGHLLPALVISAVVALILGIGMPTSAAYVISAIVLAPALVNLGVPLLAAHLFVAYFACISTITPPVALAAYAAAPIAGANPMAVGATAFRLGLVSFLIPFCFVYGPGILLMGSVVDVAVAVISATVGVIALGCALTGWLLGGPLGWVERALCLAAAVLMIVQGWQTDLAGAALFMVVVAIRVVATRRTVLAK